MWLAEISSCPCLIILKSFFLLFLKHGNIVAAAAHAGDWAGRWVIPCPFMFVLQQFILFIYTAWFDVQIALHNR